MKLAFNKNDLLESINIVIKAVSGKTTIPILTCLLLEADGEKIRMTGNDMEMTIETLVKGRVIEDGAVAIDAKLFSDIIRKLPDGEIMLVEKENVVSIFCEKATFNIPGRSAEDFVRMPKVETGDHICLSQFTLKEVIRQTIFSIAANETNPLMTGELFEVKGDTLRVISLDGHRIALRRVALRDRYEDHRVVVPGKTLTEISRILPGDTEKDVYVFFSKNHIIFEFDETTVLSRLIDGEYFNVDRMISADYETKVSVNKRALLESIDRSLLLVRETDKKPLIFKIDNEQLELSMTTVLGALREDLDVEKEGQDLMIGFNPRFLSDALRAIDDETVELYMINAKAPCFIRDAEDSYIYLILPINFIAQ